MGKSLTSFGPTQEERDEVFRPGGDYRKFLLKHPLEYIIHILRIKGQVKEAVYLFHG